MITRVEAAGTVARLYTTVTKGFALREVEHVEVTASGIVGNREFFLVDIDERLYSVPKDPIFLDYWTTYDPLANVFRVGRRTVVECEAAVRPVGPIRPFQFDERMVDGRWTPGPWDAWLSDLAGRNLRLVRCAEPGGGGDVHPVTIVSSASLASLGCELDGRPVDSRRFRLNMTLDLGPHPYREDSWAGRVVAVGDCALRVTIGIPRCLAVEHRPYDGDRKLQVQRHIRDVRGPTPGESGPAVLFGMYAGVVSPGSVRVGDRVVLTS
ncbi:MULTISPECIES: MOSC domain-containing protein [unclassified Nocardioides]|uniref:MOSC domain-containing protein n=1 Tax=unclassified Nocardioides TaxID=2615069 RepID=UPI0005A07CFD|nr:MULTISPECIES: MOSC domain-containing protein [unclassified Nocardioides]